MKSASGGNSNGDRRAELVATAAGVISRRGVDATRLSDVAAEADVSIGLLQHYFGSRDVLIREAFEVAVVGDFEDQLESHRSSIDPWQRIQSVLSELISPTEPVKEARNWLDLCATAAKEPDLQPTVSEVQLRWIGLIERAVEDGIELGKFNPALPADEVARGINALGDGMVLNLALDSSADGDAHADAMRTTAERIARLLVGFDDPGVDSEH
jgi:AcrR family transcriptional regulator